MKTLEELYSLSGKVAVVTGATGVLGGEMARGLANAGARVAILGRRAEKAREISEDIIVSGGEAMPLAADVLERDALIDARDRLHEKWGRVDVLVNAAGGNVPDATTGEGRTIFDLPPEAFGKVVDLNLLGTLLPSQVFGEAMVAGDENDVGGCIVNISSMAAHRTITRVAGYSAAKAAVENLTRWMATELSRRYEGRVRVNAIAPGFFVGEQNRALLLNEDGSLTDRGQTIVEHTPAGRFGEPEELLATLLWLCGAGAGFVNGVVVPVDGGFSAFSGV